MIKMRTLEQSDSLINKQYYRQTIAKQTRSNYIDIVQNEHRYLKITEKYFDGLTN